MKKIKRLAAFLLAMVMMLAMAMPAMAATITVTNNDPDSDVTTTGETYKVYKIFTAVKSEGTSVNTSEDEGNYSQSVSEGGAIIL